MKTYKDQLKDKRWRELRKAILLRDGYRCTVCGDTQNLQVHHTYYYDNKFMPPWNYPKESLITVCDKCHKEFHLYCEVPIKKYVKVKPPKKKVKKPKPLSKKEKQEKKAKKLIKELMPAALKAEREIEKKYKKG